MEIDCWLKGRKMTNFEKIRQLSEEEMAKYIFDLEMGLRDHVYRMRKKVAATGSC